MKVPLEWLKEFVPIRLTPEALAERLTMAGHEVVGIERGEDGPILDLELTPNRADCLSVIGLAREIGAITGRALKRGTGNGEWGTESKSSRAAKGTVRAGTRAPEPRILIEDKQGCAQYVGRLIEGVKVGSSPAWMQRRLQACGARPINNLVDITNYVLLECGQPLHAFDFDRLAEGTIRVRRARPGEPITTLDGVRRELPAEILVIADARQAVAVAGIMGGVGSEVTERTTRVLLESAWFEPAQVRRAGRRLGLASESSYRFERGVDPAGVETASRRAGALIEQLAGGAERWRGVDGTAPRARAAIAVDLDRANRWLGTRVSPPEAKSRFVRLGCRVAWSGAGTILRVSPPSYRRDLAQPADFYEELARLEGYDRIPAARPGGAPEAGRSPEGQRHVRKEILRDACAGVGLVETVNWALTSEAELARCGFDPERTVRLANPLSQDQACLRPSLLSGLLQTVRRNVTQGAAGVRVFELGSVFQPQGGFREEEQLGVVLAGVWSQDWQLTSASDFYQLKGVASALVMRFCGVAPATATATAPWAEGPACELRLGHAALGVLGQVADRITGTMDIALGVWYAELSVEALLAHARAAARARVPGAFPPAKRDLSILVRKEIPYAAIEETIRAAAGALAERVRLVDRYTGAQVPAGQHSLTFALEYRDPSRTLTAEEVDGCHARIVQALQAQHGATRR